MSVNNSISEQHNEDDVAELPDRYHRELLRKKNTMSQPVYSDERNTEENGIGYQAWKAKNGVETSEQMISSLGRALHNQGIVMQSDSDTYARTHYHDTHSNTIPNTDYRRRDLRNARLNSSETYHSPQHHRRRFDSNESAYGGQIHQHSMRPESNGHYDERHYHYPSRDNSDEFISEEQYDNRCGGQYCSSQKVKSPVISPKSHHNSVGQREIINHNRRMNNSNVPRNEYHQEPVVNHDVNQTVDFSHPSSYQSHRSCHSSSNCCCVQNQTETSRRPDSPRKKSDRKTETSIKKLYRILWLQNEQLGLLERQVSKLIEMNFTEDSVEKPAEISEEKKSKAEGTQVNKPETSDIGIMTDLPCPRCVSSENQPSSSESESEVSKKALGEESLVLTGVEIPVTRGEVASPPVSMHIEMHEYQETSSSETEESDTSEEDDTEPVGWTFYDNVVGQVNNILKTANSKKTRKKKQQSCNDEMKLAVEQLKRLGLANSEFDNNPKRVTFEEGLKEQQVNLRAQSEISMNFNALASKYLTAGGKVQDISMCNVISSNTNMSMATMRYLERHQIANRDVLEVLSKKTPSVKGRKNRWNGDKAVTSKFLDITAIRQQPKLLPKDI